GMVENSTWNGPQTSDPWGGTIRPSPVTRLAEDRPRRPAERETRSLAGLAAGPDRWRPQPGRGHAMCGRIVGEYQTSRFSDAGQPEHIGRSVGLRRCWRISRSLAGLARSRTTPSPSPFRQWQPRHGTPAAAQIVASSLHRPSRVSGESSSATRRYTAI